MPVSDAMFTIHEPSAAAWRWISAHWGDIGGPCVYSRNGVHDLRAHPGLVADIDGAFIGFAIYRCEAEQAELLALKTTVPGRGVGRALTEAVFAAVTAEGAKRLYATATNDDTDAMRFYQRNGFRVKDYRVGGFAAAMRRKKLDPDEPLTGKNGITIRDLIVLERADPMAPPPRLGVKTFQQAFSALR